LEPFSIIVAGHGADGMTRSIRIPPLLARRGNMRMLRVIWPALRRMPFELNGYSPFSPRLAAAQKQKAL
jgi:hypothetical protein